MTERETLRVYLQGYMDGLAYTDGGAKRSIRRRQKGGESGSSRRPGRHWTAVQKARKSRQMRKYWRNRKALG